MFSKLHNRLGTAGLVVAVVALVAALAGTALAAQAALNGKQKKEVEKIAKKFAGKDGAPGAQGPKGDSGSPGAAGKEGGIGKEGAKGTTGASGPTGTSGPTGVTGSTGVTGTTGATGPTGNIGDVLASGKTETGVVVMTPPEVPELTTYWAQLSFPIPLAAPIAGGHQHFINPAGKELKFNSGTFETEEVVSTVCTGTPAAPTATAGHLCVYASVLSNAEVNNISFVTPSTGTSALTETALGGNTGAVLAFRVEENELAKVLATWAVKAP